MQHLLEIEQEDTAASGEAFWSIMEQFDRRRRSKQRTRLQLLKQKVLQLAAYHRGQVSVADLLNQDWCDLEEANHCFQDLQVEGHCHFSTNRQNQYIYVFPRLA